jgi:phosphatidylglycerophosphatase A
VGHEWATLLEMAAPYFRWTRSDNSTLKLLFSQIRSPWDALPVILGTGFGTGLSPLAPGTMGSLIAVPLLWITEPLPTFAKLIFWGIWFLLGIWSSKKINEMTLSSDASLIVIDEIVGMSIAAWTVGSHPIGLAVSFLFFRIFDIVKLPPVRQLDAASKFWKGWKGGFGVMADDVLAGGQALLVVLGLQWLGWI